ncbi:hypothetical protein OROGR_001431 [Orobanche gracilis]
MSVPYFFRPMATIVCLLFILIISNTPQSLSESNSPQNIQTSYPFSPPPPPSASPPPITTTPPSFSPPGRSSSRAAVGKAIALTAASTIVLSGLLFFLLLRRSRRNVVAVTHGGTNPPSDNLMGFNGNIKGLVVDENGLDVLYWRNLQEGEGRSSFKREYYNNNLKDEREKEEEKKMVGSGRERKYDHNKSLVQEVPLLRGKSSTSQSPHWVDKEDDQILKRETSFSTKISFKTMENQNSSIQLTQHATKPPFPLPPPPPPSPTKPSSTPPLLPSPQMAVGAVAKPAVAPLPPLPPNGGAPPPPLKPHAPNKRSTSLGKGTSDIDKNEQVKLKALHWDKVNPNAVEHSMVWDRIDKGSFKFDGDLMEALFGYVATDRKSPKSEDRPSPNPKTIEKSGHPSQIFILDTRKSQNIAIVLKSLGVTRKEIIDALINGQDLYPDTIEKLAKLAPSDEEASQIIAFNGDPTRLADAESFLYHLLKSVPSAFTRFNAMLFRSNYRLELPSVRESLKSLELACNELRTRGLFFKLLEAVLKAGNRLNAGTSRGNAQAFNLTALRKLSDVKSSDGNTTLLQFVVQEVVRAEGKRCVLNRNRSLSRTSSQSSNLSESQSSEQSKDEREREYMMLGLPVVGGLSAEFSNVKKAATVDYDVLHKTITTLSAQVDEMRMLVSRSENNGGFARGMNGFLGTAEFEIKVLKEEDMRVMELVQKTKDYYQAGCLRDKGTNNTLLLFVIARDFLEMVDKVCVEIARNVQRRRLLIAYAAGSSSPESPKVFRFPKLPENFMSDNSKSGSSDSDDDTEAR